MATKPKRRTPAKPVRKTNPAKSSKATKAAKPPVRHTATIGLYGWITHTELATRDPMATKAWASKAFGWTFRPPVPSPAGDYHLFAYSEQGGGGVRGLNAGEVPHSTPTVHVADCRKAFDKAVAAGAAPIMEPNQVMPGVVIATVREPGGMLIGISGGK